MSVTEPKPALGAFYIGQDATKIVCTIQEAKKITNIVKDNVSQVEKLEGVDDPVESIGVEGLVSGRRLYGDTDGVVKVSAGKVVISSEKYGIVGLGE